VKHHVQIYLTGMNYDVTDYIPCEICNAKAVDIHHIDCRGMGGSSGKDTIENLMALCRSCHIKYGDKTKYMQMIKDIHLNKIEKRK